MSCQICQIGDASRGSLSSYAFTLMTLHFLQQRTPPVIPVLQELHEGKQPPEIIVDGWNVWYFDDLDRLGEVWQAGKNTESVSQLFVGFLRYFSETFKFDQNVICSRRLRPLTRLEKMWTGKRLAIEGRSLVGELFRCLIPTDTFRSIFASA